MDINGGIASRRENIFYVNELINYMTRVNFIIMFYII